MANPTEVQKAYLAGYIDGEGYICWGGSPQLSLESCHPEPMRFMQKIYGGKVIPRKRHGVGQTKRTVWRLRYGSDLCIKILDQLSPFMIEKKQQAEAIVKIRALQRLVKSEKHKDHIKSPLAK